MKKVALSLAGVLAAAAFAPEASALPTFARQTNSACSACHFQHFPLLNSFGRAFKAGAYTMTATSKVEGEHLSIPSNLNFGALITAGYEKESNNFSNIFVPGAGGEMQLFWGGRINDFSGFLSEFGTTGPAGGSGKVLILPEVAGDTRAGVAVFSIGQGPQGAFELLNTGATTIHRLMGNQGTSQQHNQAATAGQYVASEKLYALGGGSGAALVVVNPNMGALTVAKFIDAGAGVGGGTATVGLPFQYIRAVALFDLAGFDTGVGIQNFSGSTADVFGARSYRATIVDAQMQGEMAGMPVGIYASYGTAPVNAANPNGFNNGTAVNLGGPVGGVGTKSSFNIAGELGVIPGHATVQAGLRFGNSGGAAGSNTDNAVMVGATYELSQNQELTLHYTSQSGSAWTALGAAAVGKTNMTLLLETLF
jgi:hypothetical protein